MYPKRHHSGLSPKGLFCSRVFCTLQLFPFRISRHIFQQLSFSELVPYVHMPDVLWHFSFSKVKCSISRKDIFVAYDMKSNLRAVRGGWFICGITFFMWV